MTKRYLVLENGSIYTGEAFGAAAGAVGELVFNTGMTGYQETITDLSYANQMIVFTYPLIGNYGINRDDSESLRPAAAAIVTHEVARRPSNWRMQISLTEWAEKMNLPGITDIDTRALTKELRDQGVMKAALVDQLAADTLPKLRTQQLPTNQVQAVTVHSSYQNPNTGATIALIDFGLKNSILRSLAARQCNVIVFPADVDAKTVLEIDPDGVMLSNGPGDPQSVSYVIPTIQALQKVKALFGICLGHQLFAMANGAKTFKMKFGHRGFNHAVRSIDDPRLAFTSQNHGYAVDERSLINTDLIVTYREINDNTIEGLKSTVYPAFSVQFHPDAAPGPHDADTIFDDFLQLIAADKRRKNAQKI